MSATIPQTILAAITRHYHAPVRVPIADWMRQHLTITRKQSADYAGLPMDLDRTPHARLVVDFLNDPIAEELNIMKSSAASMTSTLIGACFHRLATDPCNILYLIGNQAEAKKMSARYWRPWTRQVFGEEMADAEDQAALFLKINGVDVILGSPTEKMLRGIQFKIIIEDESDTMDNKLSGGSQSLEVAERERVKNAIRSKIIRLSTPLKKWNPRLAKYDQPQTRIDRLYLDGDAREYRIPCPHCRAMQPVLYDDLVSTNDRKADGALDLDAIIKNTAWRCPSCQLTANEGGQKIAAVRAGEWVPTKPGSGRIWSAKHTDLVSIIGKASWGRIRHDIEHKRGTAEEAGVRRAYLAEPEDDTIEAVAGRDKETILRHCGKYMRGTCPVIPWRVVMYVDVQKNCERFPWMISALTSGGGIYVLDWGECAEFSEIFTRAKDNSVHGIYGVPLPLAVPESILRQKWPDPAKAPTKVYVTRAMIDSGYRARGSKDESDHREESVYRFCLTTWFAPEMRFLIPPAKGRAGRQITEPTVDSDVDFNGRKLPLHLYDDWAFKRDLYNIRLASDPENPTPLAKDRPRIHLPRREDLEEDHTNSEPGHSLISQLLSERLVDGEYRTPSGQVKTGWHWTTNGPNDLGDCLKGCNIIYAITSRHLLAAA